MKHIAMHWLVQCFKNNILPRSGFLGGW